MSADWRERFAHKTCSAAQAIAHIEPGRRIFIGSGAAEPVALVRALVDAHARFADNDIVHILTLGPAPYVERDMQPHFRHTAFFIGPNVREAVQRGQADFIPIFLSEIPALLRSAALKIDVALLQVTPPDARGYVSLGVSVDVVRAAFEAADLVIAQVNPRMPRTLGDTAVPVAEIDWLIDVDEPLLELPSEPVDPVSSVIGELVASLVPDGATLQVGIGRIPNAVTSALRDRHDLGVHTEMLSDGLMNLAKSGAITGLRKTLQPGKMVTSFLMGSRELYEWARENPRLALFPSDFTNDPNIIAKNARMVAINSALSIDLTGQVAADTVGGRFFSGIGGQVDFVRGAARSPGGKAIIALPSTARQGAKSRIVSALEAGAGVVTSRGDVHYVVTEYGIAQLWGKSVRERAAALIEIAHPDARADLLNEGKVRRYLLPDHPMPNRPPSAAVSAFVLPSGERVQVRPVRVSDEDAVQELLYRLSDESSFFRFFGHRVIHPHREVRSMVELEPSRSTAFVARLESSDELVAIARADKTRLGTAELGITVADAWQGRGIGRALLTRLIDDARARGFRGLTAEVLRGNHRMQRLLRRHAFSCGAADEAAVLHFELFLQGGLG